MWSPMQLQWLVGRSESWCGCLVNQILHNCKWGKYSRRALHAEKTLSISSQCMPDCYEINEGSGHTATKLSG